MVVGFGAQSRIGRRIAPSSSPPILSAKTTLITCRKLYGFAAVCELVARHAEIRCSEVNNAKVRKHFIGKGSGKRDELKAMTMEMCCSRGLKPQSDDEADEFGIHHYAATLRGIDVGLPTGSHFVRKGAT